MLAPDSPLLATAYGNLGSVISYQARFVEAEEFLLKCLNIGIKVFDSGSPRLADIYSNIGSLFADQGKLQKALKMHLKCLAIQEKALQADSPKLARTLNNVGMGYCSLGKLQEGEEVYLKALRACERLPAEHPQRAVCYSNLASLYADKGLTSKAEEMNRKCRALRKELSCAAEAVAGGRTQPVFTQLESLSQALNLHDPGFLHGQDPDRKKPKTLEPQIPRTA